MFNYFWGKKTHFPPQIEFNRGHKTLTAITVNYCCQNSCRGCSVCLSSFQPFWFFFFFFSYYDNPKCPYITIHVKRYKIRLIRQVVLQKRYFSSKYLLLNNIKVILWDENYIWAPRLKEKKIIILLLSLTDTNCCK